MPLWDPKVRILLLGGMRTHAHASLLLRNTHAQHDSIGFKFKIMLGYSLNDSEQNLSVVIRR